jgi:hypothetical protein
MNVFYLIHRVWMRQPQTGFVKAAKVTFAAPNVATQQADFGGKGVSTFSSLLEVDLEQTPIIHTENHCGNLVSDIHTSTSRIYFQLALAGSHTGC